MTDGERPPGGEQRESMTGDDLVEAEALEWTKRVQHPSFRDWGALSDWLEADLRHSISFHRLTTADEEVATAARELRVRPIEPTGPIRPPRRSTARPPVRLAKRRWGQLAAGVALVLGLGAVYFNVARRPGPHALSAVLVVTTRPGERRDVRLADGTRVAVAGGTRLVIDAAAHHADLEQGQATFSVVHDPKRAFTVRLGEATVIDVGTVFDVRRRDGRSAIAVTQGEVRVNGVGAPVDLLAGRRLRFGDDAPPQLDTLSPGVATGWQQGRFNYVQAPISDVVADIEQATGARISLTPQIASRRFSGAISLRGDVGAALRNVAPVMGLSVARKGDVWVLNPAHDPS